MSRRSWCRQEVMKHAAWACLVLLCMSFNAYAGKPWKKLPQVPTLPTPDHSGKVEVNGIKLWYAEYGHGPPVILLHGGMASSDWWGLQIPALARHYRVVVMDSRGQGRSTHDPDAAMSYRLMASDVLALMDYLSIRRSAIVGWSDGAITGLEIAIHHPGRVAKLFAFGANTSPDGYLNSSGRTPAQNALMKRYDAGQRTSYERLSPTPEDFDSFRAKMSKMWDTDPNITREQLQGIKVPTWIVDGDHDEIIKRENVDFQFSNIPGAVELIVPGTSHFAFLQKPEFMNFVLLRFMKWTPSDR